ncbi:hypothetical protein TWF281_004333 [Arthrobotrys megalospora]
MMRSFELKRPRLMDADGEPNYDEEPQWDDPRYHNEVFSNAEMLIPLDPLVSSAPFPNVIDYQNSNNGPNPRKRAREPVDDSESWLANSERWLAELFPNIVASIEPQVPLLSERRVEEVDEKANPFCDGEGAPSAHPRTIALSLTANNGKDLPEQAVVNGLLKFRLWKTKNNNESEPGRSSIGRMPMLGGRSNPTPKVPVPNADGVVPGQDANQISITASLDPNNQVNYLPPDFGRGTMRLNSIDSKLFRFYLLAVCSGRTLLDKQNIHKLEIAPMAVVSPGVCHAVLSLASAYILDYRPSETLAERANYHYQESVKWLTKELKNTENYEPGKEEALVTTLVLLIHNEIICWESSTSNEVPAWYRATRIARRVLDSSDPGYRYKDLPNVQESRARHRIGNEIAFCEILSSAFAPIEEEDLKGRCPYSWLMGGSTKELTTIEGNTGMCARVLYTLQQITYITGLFAQDVRTEVWPKVAGKIRTRLERIQQWSELSPGYPHAQELLDACILDENGLVQTKAEATDLIAESYIQAALIYLECRFFRRTPFHASVRRNLDILIKCFDRCPTSGDLYTAQTPVFGVAIAGVVAITEKERDFCRKYVTGTCGTGERGNLPILQDTLNFIWEWMDKHRPSEDADSASLPNRRPWWEELVAAFNEAKGRRDFA